MENIQLIRLSSWILVKEIQHTKQLQNYQRGDISEWMPSGRINFRQKGTEKGIMVDNIRPIMSTPLSGDQKKCRRANDLLYIDQMIRKVKAIRKNCNDRREVHEMINETWILECFKLLRITETETKLENGLNKRRLLP